MNQRLKKWLAIGYKDEAESTNQFFYADRISRIQTFLFSSISYSTLNRNRDDTNYNETVWRALLQRNPCYWSRQLKRSWVHPANLRRSPLASPAHISSFAYTSHQDDFSSHFSDDFTTKKRTSFLNFRKTIRLLVARLFSYKACNKAYKTYETKR